MYKITLQKLLVLFNRDNLWTGAFVLHLSSISNETQTCKRISLSIDSYSKLINVNRNVATGIVSRSEWGASKPKTSPKQLATIPAEYVVVSHTGAKTNCFSSKVPNCDRYVNNMQTLHKQNGLNDIAYNFLVGPDAKVYEGVGFDVQGEHTVGYNDKSIGLAFMGNFNTQTPTENYLNAAKSFLESAVQQNKLAADYKLIGQSQVVEIESPGKHLYNIIKTWSHWVEKP